MKTWHKVLIAVVVYEIGAYVWNQYVATNSSLPGAPLDGIGSILG
jgi:hypothetical protein